MTQLKNDTFLRALLKQPVEYTPIWMMRQAGRYLPEYRATRARAGSFMGLCTSPDYATEVTLQPLERFPLDAAILFSDILTVPDAMGLGLSFAEGEGPRFARPLRDEAAIKALQVAPLDKLQYVFDAVSSIRKALDGRVPLIGFSGSPFTLACYMIEGAGSADFRHVKAMLYGRPELLHHILRITADSVTAYLNAQIDATFLIVTHDINSTRTVPDNIGLLYHKHLAMFGPREMLLSSTEPVVAQFLNAQRVGPIGMSEEKHADQLAAEADIEMPPLPPIPRQLEPSDGRPRRAAREPGVWCRENGITPPPGSFDENMSMAPGSVS